FDVRVTLPVAVRVQNEHSPALSLLLVLCLRKHLGVEPALDGPATREPQAIFGVEVEVMRTETRVDGRDLPRLRVVHLHLAAALSNRERHRRRMCRTLFAEIGRLVGS